jgi:hypothetical protein
MRKIILATMLSAVFAVPAFSQGISPLVEVIHANKKGHAEGTFQVVNQTIGPLATTLEVRGFALDESGHFVAQDLDTTKVHVKLDSMSARIPPQSSHAFTFTADCDGPCQFWILTFDGAAKHIENGVKIVTVIAETIYVTTDPLQKDDVSATWTDSKTLVLENHSAKMARATPNDVHYAAKTEPYPDFTMEPNARRVLTFENPPTKVEVKFEKFRIETSPQ